MIRRDFKIVLLLHSQVICAERERSRLLARIVALHHRDNWKANGISEIGIRRAKSEPYAGLATRRESSNVCACGGLTIGYEAHDIEHQIRRTRTGIEGSGNARRRRTEGSLGQPIWDEAPSKNFTALS